MSAGDATLNFCKHNLFIRRMGGVQCGCVCLGSGFGCAPPLLAGVLGCVRAPLAPSHSWHGCAVWVCVFGLGFWLRPATPGWGVWAVCVLRLHPATPGTGARCGCVCLGSGFGCAPPLLAGVLGCVCAPLAPSHSWPRVRGVGVCVWARVLAAPRHSSGFRLQNIGRAFGVPLVQIQTCCLSLVPNLQNCLNAVLSRYTRKNAIC